MKMSLPQRQKKCLERKEEHQERINSEKIIRSFLVEMFQLYKVLEYAKFYSFVPEVISVMHIEKWAKIAQM